MKKGNKNTDLLEEMKMMQAKVYIYKICKISASLEITRIILKKIYSNAFSRKMIDFYFLKDIN